MDSSLIPLPLAHIHAQIHKITNVDLHYFTCVQACIIHKYSHAFTCTHCTISPMHDHSLLSQTCKMHRVLKGHAYSYTYIFTQAAYTCTAVHTHKMHNTHIFRLHLHTTSHNNTCTHHLKMQGHILIPPVQSHVCILT